MYLALLEGEVLHDDVVVHPSALLKPQGGNSTTARPPGIGFQNPATMYLAAAVVKACTLKCFLAGWWCEYRISELLLGRFRGGGGGGGGGGPSWEQNNQTTIPVVVERRDVNSAPMLCEPARLTVHLRTALDYLHPSAAEYGSVSSLSSDALHQESRTGQWHATCESELENRDPTVPHASYAAVAASTLESAGVRITRRRHIWYSMNLREPTCAPFPDCEGLYQTCSGYDTPSVSAHTTALERTITP
ncbi:hypothetical protein BZA05DRAFT_415334 [Tricharina praecox]|uniref:uncharacterized protein n=1 Tax=Tricharina praecox TaxID=43433 RepID=UPI00221FB1F8|nr:uncharacterized protein BZA05DRAFT_415334 [Tricharina praecox]KAI5857963.1 hypothetical protein BZA05DRAFT_415334 [Tricharina praecox]